MNVFDQLSHDCNAGHSTGPLYSWDATNPVTRAIGDRIQTKNGSANCSIPRPDGSVAGLGPLTNPALTTDGRLAGGSTLVYEDFSQPWPLVGYLRRQA